MRPADVDGLVRYWPSPDLAPFVEHHWVLRWDVTAPTMAETVPQPCVHLVLEPGASAVVGVSRARFTRTLRGRGRMIGTRFRPGAFRPFLRGPVSSLAGRRLPLSDVFGRPGRALERRAFAPPDDRGAIAAIEDFLRSRRPRLDESAERAGRMVTRIESDRSLTRVDLLAAEFGTGVRSLQRLFGEYVGASPKQVLLGFRLLDAADRATRERDVNWSDLALELGFADQAHLIRAFKKLVGRSPADYARWLDAPPAARR